MKFSKMIEQGSEEAVRLHYGEDMYVFVKPANNRQFDRIVQRMIMPYADDLSDSGLPNDENALETIMYEATAQAILTGWEGLEDDDGNAIPYSHEKALELLRQNYKFYRAITSMSQKLKKTDEDNLGN